MKLSDTMVLVKSSGLKDAFVSVHCHKCWLRNLISIQVVNNLLAASVNYYWQVLLHWQ